MSSWLTQEAVRLRKLKIDPQKSSPERLVALVNHFRRSGTLFAVTEGSSKPRVSKDLGRKVRKLTGQGKLDWVLARTEVPTKLGEHEAVPRELFAEIRELAEVIEGWMRIPKPDTPLQTLDPEKSRAIERKIGEAALSGDSHPLIEGLLTAFQPSWWTSNGPPNVILRLTAKQEALLDRFLRLSTSGVFKKAKEQWSEAAENYLMLVRSKRNVKDTREAYQRARQAAVGAKKALWGAVESLRWRTN